MKPFQNLFNGYAQAYNKMYERRGGLFLHFLKRKPIETDTYLAKVIHYIHHNPVHHGLCKDIMEWKYSSVHAFWHEKATRVEKQKALDWFGNTQEFWRFHKTTPDQGLIGELEF